MSNERNDFRIDLDDSERAAVVGAVVGAAVAVVIVIRLRVHNLIFGWRFHLVLDSDRNYYLQSKLVSSVNLK